MATLEKPRYFPGEFLSVGDYTAEQDYQALLRHTHDGVLHTPGIAEGLTVFLALAPERVAVSPGVAVDAQGQLVILAEPREVDLPSPFVDSYLVLGRTEEEVPPRQPGGLPRIRDTATLEWLPATSMVALGSRLVLAGVVAGPKLDFALRGQAGLEVGALQLVSPRLPRKREPALVGWSAGADHGVRISASELRITPLTPEAEATVSLQGGRLGIGTTLPGSPLDVREPNAPLAGPGLISSHGTIVTGTGRQLDRLLAVGDVILTRDRQGQQAQSAVASVLPDGRVVTTQPLEAQDAPWRFRRRAIARFASPDERALLTCDATAQVRIGRSTSQVPARLVVAGGQVLLRDGAVEFQEGGRIQDSSGANEVRFDERERLLSLRTAGPLRLRAQGVAGPVLPGLFLATDGNVGLGTEESLGGDTLTVAGAVRSVADKAHGILGGFVFPDGTVQQTAEIAIPVGGIIDWWRPNAQVQIPDEYRICDGSPVDDKDSPFNGLSLPSLTSRFIRGVGSVEEIDSGGSDTHPHGYTVPPHTHPFTHTHPDYSGLSGKANENDGPADRAASMFCDRGHQHTFRAQIFSSATTNTAANSTAGTQATSEPASLLPPFIGLLKLIRIK